MIILRKKQKSFIAPLVAGLGIGAGVLGGGLMLGNEITKKGGELIGDALTS